MLRARGSSSSYWGLLLAAVCGAVSVAGCEYDPHPLNGALRCSMAGECPEGYSCESNMCWSAGLGGTALDPSLIARYSGEWVLTAGSTVHTVCDNNYTEDTPLSPDPTDPSIMYLSSGTTGVSDSESNWLCDLSLRLNTGGAHLYGSNTVCGDDGGDPVFTWTATKFDVVTADGITATHTATYKRKDEYFDGRIVNCNQMVTASMTKQ